MCIYNMCIYIYIYMESQWRWYDQRCRTNKTSIKKKQKPRILGDLVALHSPLRQGVSKSLDLVLKQPMDFGIATIVTNPIYPLVMTNIAIEHDHL